MVTDNTSISEISEEGTVQPRCPEYAQFPGDTLIGCGSTNIREPDDEGLCDCLDCGIWFPAGQATRRVAARSDKTGWRKGQTRRANEDLKPFAAARCIDLYRTVKPRDVTTLPEAAQALWKLGWEISASSRDKPDREEEQRQAARRE